ncbi:MAG: hypothetical protein DRP46_14215 [Candidatus Zixiibacteriota bacterium]|nr:MAG: hypothetical protein DRP46_14215 [candidate division Zixibacteria bacterium]
MISWIDLWQGITPFLPAIGGATGQLIRQLAAWGKRKAEANPKKPAYWNWWETLGKMFISVVGGATAGMAVSLGTGNVFMGFLMAITTGYTTIDGYERGLAYFKTLGNKN